MSLSVIPPTVFSTVSSLSPVSLASEWLHIILSSRPSIRFGLRWYQQQYVLILPLRILERVVDHIPA